MKSFYDISGGSHKIILCVDTETDEKWVYETSHNYMGVRSIGAKYSLPTDTLMTYPIIVPASPKYYAGMSMSQWLFLWKLYLGHAHWLLGEFKDGELVEKGGLYHYITRAYYVNKCNELESREDKDLSEVIADLERLREDLDNANHVIQRAMQDINAADEYITSAVNKTDDIESQLED